MTQNIEYLIHSYDMNISHLVIPLASETPKRAHIFRPPLTSSTMNELPLVFLVPQVESLLPPLGSKIFHKVENCMFSLIKDEECKFLWQMSTYCLF